MDLSEYPALAAARLAHQAIDRTSGPRSHVTEQQKAIGAAPAAISEAHRKIGAWETARAALDLYRSPKHPPPPGRCAS